MGPRQKINKQIKEVIEFYFKYYKGKEISLKEIQKFETLEEPRIQYFAHNWIKGNNQSRHMDRYDIKRSLRQQLRDNILSFLNKNKIIIVNN